MPDPLDNAQERAKKFLREDPFQDASGGNPYGDPNRKPGGDGPPSSNPYATSTDSSEGAQRPIYVTTQEPRGALLLALGTSGLLICAAGITAMVFRAYIPGGANWLPIPFISLAASVPAVSLSLADMEAMDAGAMAPTGWGPARAAFVFGLLGCLMTTAYAGMLALVLLKWVEL